MTRAVKYFEIVWRQGSSGERTNPSVTVWCFGAALVIKDVMFQQFQSANRSSLALSSSHMLTSNIAPPIIQRFRTSGHFKIIASVQLYLFIVLFIEQVSFFSL